MPLRISKRSIGCSSHARKPPASSWSHAGTRPTSIGRDVEITQVLRFADWGTWDEIRRRMVLDPEIGAWHAARRRLARRAERHFCRTRGLLADGLRLAA